MLSTELTQTDVEAILAGDEGNLAAKQFQFYPLHSPGMPTAGPDFVNHAKALGEADPLTIQAVNGHKEVTQSGLILNGLYLRALYDQGTFSMPVDVSGRSESVSFVPGHLWGWDADGPCVPTGDGPRVMVVGKMPGHEEMEYKRNLVGPSGTCLRNTLEQLGMPVEQFDDWYVCNLVRWVNCNPKSNSLPQRWIKDCLPILHQELRLVRPDYILTLGSEATKAMLGAANTVTNMVGRYEEVQIPLHLPGEEPAFHTAKVMAVTHPAAVLRTTELFPAFEASVKNFVQLVKGEEFTDDSDEFDLRYIYKLRDLRELVDEILAEPGIKRIAVDAEWHGEHPGETGAYLRSVQFSHKPKFGAAVVLAHEGGDRAFWPSIPAAIKELTRLLDRDDVQIGGHFFNSDLPWLEHYGLHIAHRCTVPLDLDENPRIYAGGFDTALAAHAYNETSELKLELLAVRYCGARRWDVDLIKWRKEFCKKHDLKEKDLEGYGECPADVLLPYSAYDAAYTRQLMEDFGDPDGMLSHDRFGNSCWLPFKISMMAFQAYNEMGTVGVKVDRQRIDVLTDTFMDIRSLQLEELRRDIKWPTFNPRSSQQCVEFLFGEQYSTKIDKTSGERISVRPNGAVSLYLPPVKTTGTRGQPWAKVASRGEAHKYTPSTDKEVCGILGMHHPLAMRLRDIRLTDQVLKSVFRPPLVEDGVMVRDPLQQRVYAGGIASFICHDQRVRSAFLQTMETGRSSSARPPLQNISKRREDDYARILGELYQHAIRSFVVSNTDPSYGEITVLLEADYQGAELFGMATQSRCATMIDHCLRAALPEDDPNFYDIHSNVAIRAFRLDCEPTKAGLASIDAIGKRISAKNIIFGIGYGRMAEACARQAQEEGVDLSVQEAQEVINTIFQEYPEIVTHQELLRGRVRKPGWIRSCFGRYRRCIPTDDLRAMGELERQFLNFPFQSMVADATSYALYYLYHHPRREELGYKIVLQIHDAVVLEVPVRSLDVVYNEILPECMVDRISFRACDLDGRPYPDSPEYRFTIDEEACIRWGEKLSWDDCDTLGIDRKYGKPPKQ
jgi:uracil-DNA glycosylase family 4